MNEGCVVSQLAFEARQLRSAAGGIVERLVIRIERSQSYIGLRSTRMTESPRRNILLMNRSLFTGLAFFLPFPV